MKARISIKKQFIIFFLLVAAISLIFLSFILKTTIERYFNNYIWTSQVEAQKKIISYLSQYYATFGTWKNFDARQIARASKSQHRYFSLYDPMGKLIFTTENDVDPFCSDPKHKYWENIYPIMVGRIMVGWVNIGQFTDNIYSPEDIAFRRSIFYGIGISFLIITLIIALPLSLIISSRLSRPIRKLKTAADNMASGDLTTNLDNDTSIDEIIGLTSSLDRLRKSLLLQENMRKELATDISHELRTPVNIIQNQLEGMIDGVLPITNERMEGLLKEMQRLTGLIGELEKITDIETNPEKIIYEKINLSKALEETVAGFEGTAALKKIYLKTDVDKDIFINANRDKITQVIINLLSNAFKFTEKGGITVKLYKKDDKNILEVTDTGVGIPKEDTDKIFERFYRVDKSRSRDTGGAGLGLAIVKTIVGLHGWNIMVESEPNKGTTFKVII